MNNIEGADLEGKAPRNQTETQLLEKKLYTTKDGNLGVPAKAIHGCLLDASKRFTVKRSGKNVKLSMLFSGCIHIGPSEIISLGVSKYLVNVQSGVNPKSKGRIVIRRPDRGIP